MTKYLVRFFGNLLTIFPQSRPATAGQSTVSRNPCPTCHSEPALPHLPHSRMWQVVGSMWGEGSSPPTTYHTPPTVYHLQDTNYLCFQQHSRLSPTCGKPALYFHRYPRFAPYLFKVTTVSSFPVMVTSCHTTAVRAEPPASSTPQMQWAVSRRQSARAKRKKAIHHSPFTIALIACPCSSICRLLTPES